MPYLDALTLQALVLVAVLIAVNTVLGILAALARGQFQASQVGRWLGTAALPYLGGLLILAYLSVLQEELAALFFAATATAVITYIADIKQKLGHLKIGKDIDPPLPP